MTHQEFDALAERLLHSIIRSGLLYQKAVQGAVQHQTVTGAIALSIAMAEQFVAATSHRRAGLRESAVLLLEEILLIEDGNAIRAIKLVRERTGMNLKGAKLMVDRERERLGL